MVRVGGGFYGRPIGGSGDWAMIAARGMAAVFGAAASGEQVVDARA